MKRKFLLLLLCVWGCGAFATSIRVDRLSQADYSTSVETIGKMLIFNEALHFYDRQGQELYAAPLSDVGAVTFGDATTAVYDLDTDKYSVFPNPAMNVLKINGLDAQTTLRLYNLDGQVVIETNGTEIDVENVPAGQYLLQFNHQIFKIIKQ